MTWFRLPLFIWSYYATSIIFVLATPVVAMSMVLIVLERVSGIGVFDPTKGGDPSSVSTSVLVLLSSRRICHDPAGHGSDIGSHLMLLPKRVFGYTAVAFSSVSIAVFSFFVWAHHMFIMGISNVFCAGIFLYEHVGCSAIRD